MVSIGESAQVEPQPQESLWYWLVSLGCVNQTALDLQGNVERIKVAIAQCRQVGSRFLCLPELAVSAYGCEDMFWSRDFCTQVEAAVAELVNATENFSLLVGAPIRYNHGVYNGTLLIQNQQIVAIIAKKILAQRGLYYESRWFTPWQVGAVEFMRYAGGSGIAFGDPCLSLGALNLGVEICEESWSKQRPLLHAPPCDVVFNLSASHFAMGKNSLRQNLVAQSSQHLDVHYFYVNLLGVDSAKTIYEGGALWGYRGEILYESPRFSLCDVVLSHHQLTLGGETDAGYHRQLSAVSSGSRPVIAVSAEMAGLHQQKLHLSQSQSSHSAVDEWIVVSGTHHHLIAQHQVGQATALARLSSAEAVHRDNHQESMWEFFYAQTLGLWDYLRKSASRCYVLSLSGGCDSAVVACLVSGMVTRVLKELGYEVFCERVGLDPSELAQDDAARYKQLINQLLHCVYQVTDQSSTATQNAAQNLGDGLGIDLEVVFIQNQVNEYVAWLEKRLSRPLNWDGDGLVLENIQARLRSPYPWMLANAYNGVLLCTANRSEAAVGYTTMDGDTSGGLAPISGVSKFFLLRWLRWVHEGGLADYISGDSLQGVLALEPSAELRPAVYQQTDQRELMPYEVMAQIETLFVLEQRGEAEIMADLSQRFPHIASSQLQQYVHTFYRRWQSSQWKRERMAVGFHVAEMNVDPQSWYRYPVLSQRTVVQSAAVVENENESVQHQ